jgi:UDP-N-acetylmuramate dehydrogenase
MHLSAFPHPCERDKPLSACSTFGIGGPARFFSEVNSIEQMQALIGHCLASNLRYIVIGKGSNCLFADEGFDGLVILNKIAFCQFEGTVVHAGAGYSFSLLGTQTARNGFSGLEFASGIPGTVGGAIYMNAGASGTETKDPLLEVCFLDENNELKVLSRGQIDFGYRFSSFQQKRVAILSGKFSLTLAQEARNNQLKIIDYRKKTQPLSEASAGCFFSNPGVSAGALIQQCGLKGLSVGDAEVSTVHGNFLINKNRATAKDVLTLAKEVQKTVEQKTGIALEIEVRYIPHRLSEEIS